MRITYDEVFDGFKNDHAELQDVFVPQDGQDFVFFYLDSADRRDPSSVEGGDLVLMILTQDAGSCAVNDKDGTHFLGL